MGAVGAWACRSTIAIALHTGRVNSLAVDDRSPIGRQPGCRRGRPVGPPLHAGDGVVLIDDPAVSSTALLVEVQAGRWLHWGGSEVPILLADPQRPDHRVPLEAAFEPAGLIFAYQVHNAVLGAAAKPRFDRVAVAHVGDCLRAANADLHGDDTAGGRYLADIVGLSRKLNRWRWCRHRIGLA